MATAKGMAQTLLKSLPDDCTFDDIHYHLNVVAKVQNSLDAADREGTLTSDEVERRLARSPPI